MDQEFFQQQTGVDLSELTDQQLVYLQAQILQMQKTRSETREWWHVSAKPQTADMYG
jgi:hypothetical protein